MFDFEEYKTSRKQIWGWMMVLAFSMLIIGWGVFIHIIVRDVPREWDFGTLEDTPSKSKYSTVEPPADANDVPRQVEMPLLREERFKK
jgi:hypothetical protein